MENNRRLNKMTNDNKISSHLKHLTAQKISTRIVYTNSKIFTRFCDIRTDRNCFDLDAIHKRQQQQRRPKKNAVLIVYKFHDRENDVKNDFIHIRGGAQRQKGEKEFLLLVNRKSVNSFCFAIDAPKISLLI